jgi:hypothetical protein
LRALPHDERDVALLGLKLYHTMEGFGFTTRVYHTV